MKLTIKFNKNAFSETGLQVNGFAGERMLWNYFICNATA